MSEELKVSEVQVEIKGMPLKALLKKIREWFPTAKEVTAEKIAEGRKSFIEEFEKGHFVDQSGLAYFELLGKGDDKYKKPFVLKLRSFPEYELVKGYFGHLALIPSLVHLPSDIYQPLARQNRTAARHQIKPLTAHNEKMGYNWGVLDTEYVFSDEPVGLPKDSNYWNFRSKWPEDFQKVEYEEIQLNQIVRERVPLDISRQPLAHRNMTGAGEDFYTDYLEEESKEDGRMRGITEEEFMAYQKAVEAQKTQDHQRIWAAVEDLRKVQNHSEELTYVRQVTFPFAKQNADVRIPRIAGVDTKVYEQRGDFTFTATGAEAVVFVSHQFVAGPHIAVLRQNGTAPFTVATSKDSVDLILRYNDATGVQTDRRWPFNIMSTGRTIQQLTDEAVVNQSINLADVFDSARLVSSGARLYKAYKADNDSGEVDALTFRRTVNMGQSLDYVLQNSKGAVEYYGKTSNCNCGYGELLAESIYLPVEHADLDDMHQSDTTYLGGVNSRLGGFGSPYAVALGIPDSLINPIDGELLLSNYFLGPLMLTYNDGTDWQLDFDLESGTSQPRPSAILSRSLMNGQTAIFRMKGLQVGQTYRIEYNRNFEGIPKGSVITLGGMKSCRLESAASALELLRQTKVGQVAEVGESYKYRSVLSIPITRTSHDYSQMGIDPEHKFNQDQVENLISKLMASVKMRGRFNNKQKSKFNDFSDEEETKKPQPNKNKSQDSAAVLIKQNQNLQKSLRGLKMSIMSLCDASGFARIHYITPEMYDSIYPKDEQDTNHINFGFELQANGELTNKLGQVVQPYIKPGLKYQRPKLILKSATKQSA